MKLILTFIILWVSAAALGACAAISTQLPAPTPTDPNTLVCPSDFCHKATPSAEERASCAVRTSRVVQDFAMLNLRMNAKQVCAVVGVPDWDAGSGLAISVYDLADGSRVLIGFAGPQEMVYVQQEFKDGTAKVLMGK